MKAIMSFAGLLSAVSIYLWTGKYIIYNNIL